GVDSLGRERDRVVPRDRLPRRADAAHRLLQAVGVGVEVLQREHLRADVPAAEGVELVSANRDHPVPIDVDVDPTHRLAERTRAGDGALHPERMPSFVDALQRHAGSAWSPLDTSRPPIARVMVGAMQAELEIVSRIAREAGAIVSEIYAKDFAVAYKSERDP